MARKKTRINKEAKKRVDKKCYFCDCCDYDLLDVHRILPGEDGGLYTDFNTVTCCANCHRKVHAGRMKLFRKYLSTSGRWILHYLDENGVEHFD